jgi:hypothetical protein
MLLGVQGHRNTLNGQDTSGAIRYPHGIAEAANGHFQLQPSIFPRSSPVDARQQARIAENESRFRAMNERITRALDDFDPDLETFSILCECALTECEDMVELTTDDYRRVRSNPRWFAILPDHIIVATETAVEQHPGFWIVEKQGLGGEIAADLAP